MTLTLSIRNFSSLDNGMPTEFVLHRRGALIGRAPTCDWSLPDPRNFISSRHCEVTFADGFYTLADISMNGTILGGQSERMSGPRRIAQGDVFVIGQYEVVAALGGEAIGALERDAEAASAAARAGEWNGWASHGAEPPLPVWKDGDWGAPPVVPGTSDGWGAAPAAGGGWEPQTGPSLSQPGAFGTPSPAAPPPASGGWSASASVPLPKPVSAWDTPEIKAIPASDWSSAAPDRPPAPTPDDVWGRIADGNVVDWARGGFGQPTAPRTDPLSLSRGDPRAALGPPVARVAPASDWGTPTAAPPPASPLPPPPAVPRSAPASDGLDTFLKAAGLDAAQLKDRSAATLERAGRLFRQMVAGLVVMMEARARAKSQMGAESTAFSFDGNNPVKFARTPEDAMASLLNPPEPRFMEGTRAIEDSYFDLQSHQMATLKAMQGALRATLDRFSPTAIRQRADAGGLLGKIMPGARNAALWEAYEKEFGGVAQGSDEAFMDVFAKEFRKAYDEQAHAQRKR